MKVNFPSAPLKKPMKELLKKFFVKLFFIVFPVYKVTVFLPPKYSGLDWNC